MMLSAENGFGIAGKVRGVKEQLVADLLNGGSVGAACEVSVFVQ